MQAIPAKILQSRVSQGQRGCQSSFASPTMSNPSALEFRCAPLDCSAQLQGLRLFSQPLPLQRGMHPLETLELQSFQVCHSSALPWQTFWRSHSASQVNYRVAQLPTHRACLQMVPFHLRKQIEPCMRSGVGDPSISVIVSDAVVLKEDYRLLAASARWIPLGLLVDRCDVCTLLVFRLRFRCKHSFAPT